MSRHRNPARNGSAPQYPRVATAVAPAQPSRTTVQAASRRSVTASKVQTANTRPSANAVSVLPDHAAPVTVSLEPFPHATRTDQNSRTAVRSSLSRESPELVTRNWNRSVKRLIDIVVSLTALCVLAPLMIALALIVKLESRGPALFVQVRVGKDGKVFNLLKFRTMRVDAEMCTGPVFARPNDPRCTRIGHFMRCHSLDELPQFINVLRGEMSLVGPRPERPFFVSQFSQNIPQYLERHREKAGITGWAQINGLRGDTSIEEHIHYDLYYVNNWSLRLDLKIMARTIAEIFEGHNAC